MKTRFLATTAIAAVLSTAAFAQDQAPLDPNAGMEDPATIGGEGIALPEPTFNANDRQMLASTLIGQTVYNGPSTEAEAIGDINDVLMSPDGEADAVVIGVGGFLGIGEKEVALAFDNIEIFVREDGSHWLTVNTTVEELETAPAFDRAQLDQGMEVAGNDIMNDTTDTMGVEDPAMDGGLGDEADLTVDAEGEAGGDMEVASNDIAQDAVGLEDPNASAEGELNLEGDMIEGEGEVGVEGDAGADLDVAQSDDAAGMTDEDMAADPMADESLTGESLSLDAISAEELIGARVYASNDNDIGEIGDVMLSDEGDVEAFVVDVGGFLGIGEKPVALAVTDVTIMRDENDWLSVYTNYTEEQLEGSTAFDQEAYENDPNSVVLR